MDSELQSLYQQTVLEHCRSPRNFHALAPADRVAQGFNPLCGDKVTVYLREEEREAGSEGILPSKRAESPPSSEGRGTKNGREAIAAISFEAAGCAICLASASMMTELLQGEAQDEARRLAEQVLAAFEPESENGLDSLGDIVALGSVRAYPSRIRCVTLPWRTFTAALDGEADAVSTE